MAGRCSNSPLITTRSITPDATRAGGGKGRRSQHLPPEGLGQRRGVQVILHDDNTCTVPGQSIGYFNSNYNEYVYVADMAEYTGNESAYASYPCTFDGKDTFSFYLIYYVSSGYFSQGTEKLVFESEPDTTPIVDIEFQGIETTATGFRAPKLYFSAQQLHQVLQGFGGGGRHHG